MTAQIRYFGNHIMRWEEPTGRIKIINMAKDLQISVTGSTGFNGFSGTGTLNKPYAVGLSNYTYSFIGTTGTIVQLSQTGATINGNLNVSGGIDPIYLEFSETNTSNPATGGLLYVSDGTDSNIQGDLIYKNQYGQTVDVISTNVPLGTNYGDYFIWDGTDYISMDTNIALGFDSGATNQQNQAIAIGYEAGNTGQVTNSVAIGPLAGFNSLGNSTVAMGYQAGAFSSGSSSVLIGELCGNINQGNNSIAIGLADAVNGQGDNTIYIGYLAGFNNFTYTTNTVAIGRYAFYDTNVNDSICINASGNPLDGSNSALYINPIRKRNDFGAKYILCYNTGTSEVTANPLNNVKYSSNLAATGISTNSYTSSNTGAINIQSLNMLAPSFTGSYALSVSYGSSISITGPNGWIVSSITDTNNSSYGASWQVYNTVNTPNNLSLRSKGVLFSNNNFPYVYNSSSNPPVLQLQIRTLSGTGGYTVNGFPNSGFDSYICAYYIPL